MKTDRLLAKAVTAHVLAALGTDGPVEVARSLWPRDATLPAVVALLTRAATSPGTTTTSGWADVLAVAAVGAFIGSLKDSAAAALINRAPRVSLAGRGSISLPYASSTGSTPWVVEGGPIPVAQGVTNAVSIVPRKLALIESATREQLESAVTEDWVQVLLRDSATLALDTSLFSNAAASATRPPGLVAGIAATTASTATIAQNACVSDFRALTDAIAAVAGGPIMYVTSPGRAVAAKAYLPALADQIFGSAFVSSAALLAVAVNAFTSAWGPEPEIQASLSAVVHMEDTSPQPIGSTGTPNVVAAPTRSFFQTDSVAFRMILRAGWALRIPNAAAWISTGMAW